MITVDQIYKTYKTKGKYVDALKNISFSIDNGESICILGLNGSGKTTLIELLTGLLNQNKGEIIINGFTKKDGVNYRKQFSTVFQQSSKEFYLNVYDNLLIHAMLYGYKNKELKRRVSEALEFFELEKYINCRVNELSGGYSRRLQCAKALMIDTNIYIFDEPTVGMDIIIKDKFFTKIDELKTQEKTIVFTTQQLDEVDKISDNLVILNEGIIIHRGSLLNIRNKWNDVKKLQILARPFSDNQSALIMQSITNYNSRIAQDCVIKHRQGSIEITVNDNLSEIMLLVELISSNCEIIDFSVKKPTLTEIMLGMNNINKM